MPVAHREIFVLSVRHLAELQLPTTLVLRVSGVEPLVVWTASRERYAVAHSTGKLAFSPVEYEAVCAAAEQMRASRGELATWCLRKLAEPGWRLSVREAVGARVSAPERDAWCTGSARVLPHRMAIGWSFGLLFEALGVELLDVVVEATGEERAA